MSLFISSIGKSFVHQHDSNKDTGTFNNTFIEPEALCQTTIRNCFRQTPTAANFF